MTPPDAQHTYDPRFATDLDVADAQTAPTRSADALVVHGMLSMISPDEPARLEERIERAIAAVHAEAAHASPLARIGQPSQGLATAGTLRTGRAAWRRRIALAGGGIGIAAVLGFAVLFTPSGPSQSGSQAYAALDSIRAATARTGDRTFRVRIEHGGPRDRVREGELVLGSGGRFTMTWRGPSRGVALVTGFSGAEYWAVLPDGTIRTADHPAKIKLPPLLGTEPARPGEDEDAEQLTLDSMLARLERGYEITFADGAPPATGAGGAPLVEVVATRRAGAGRRDRDPQHPPPMGDPDRRGSRPDRSGHGERPGEQPPGPGGPGRGGPGPFPGPGGPGPGPGPGGGLGPGADIVRILADASTFDVERLEARWTSGMPRTLVIERMSGEDAPASRPPEWFTPAAHARDR
jgi:hypothetical protein